VPLFIVMDIDHNDNPRSKYPGLYIYPAIRVLLQGSMFDRYRDMAGL